MPLSTAEIKNIMLGIEDRFPVDTWLVNGIHVWPLLRMQIYFQLFFAGRAEVSRQIHRNRPMSALVSCVKLANGMFRFSKSYLSDFEHNSAAGCPVDALFLTCTVHRTLCAGSWYDKYCDPFVDALASLGLRSIVLETAAKEEYRVPRRGRSRFIQPAIDGIMIRSRLRSKSFPLTESLAGFADMIAGLDKIRPGMALPSLESLRANVFLLIRLKQYFRKKLAVMKPSVVFVAEYYSICGMALILACRESRITSVDIQHGMQGEEHPAYGCWSKVPETGYELLPSVFWCWSDYEAAAINKWSEAVHSIHKTFVGGDLWLNLWRGKDSELAGHYDSLIAGLKRRAGRQLHVLVTLSLLADLKEWIVKAIRDSAYEMYWWIRVHPCKFEERETVRRMLKEFGLDNVILDEATDFPLQAVLRHVSVNVTAFSSTVFDAGSYGIPSVLTDDSGVTLFSDQAASGLVVTASNADELLRAIRGQAAKYGTGQRGLESETTGAREIVGKFLSAHCGINGTALQ